MQTSKRVAIIGVTGFLGRGLPGLLAAEGFSVTGVSRAGNGDVAGVDGWASLDTFDFSGHYAVINLAGEPIDQRWNDRTRRLFHESRVGVSTQIVQAIAKLPTDQAPKVLINGSAVGIYGDRQDEVLRETAVEGSGYLAELCSEWEAAGQQAESLGLRVIRLRTGIVLGKKGRAFEQLCRVFRFGIGGRLGNGQQWMPWIHVDDLRAAIVHALLSSSLRGPVNGCAPHPERNRDFTKKLAAALHRPAIFPAPAFALKLVLGEFSSALLGGQRALPSALEADGFRFRFPTLELALADLIDR